MTTAGSPFHPRPGAIASRVTLWPFVPSVSQPGPMMPCCPLSCNATVCCIWRAEMEKPLEQLKREMIARFRDLEIAEGKGLNQIALERHYQAYMKPSTPTNLLPPRRRFLF